MPITVLGSTTKNTFLATEADKIYIEATCGATALKKGQPVKLSNTGTLNPWAKADLIHTLVGYAYADCAIGELVTIVTRGYAIIYGISTAALNCGPVAYQAYNAVDTVGGCIGYSEYANSATAAENNGWALDDAAGDAELVRILLMD
jgi:hypothetical protein